MRNQLIMLLTVLVMAACTPKTATTIEAPMADPEKEVTEVPGTRPEAPVAEMNEAVQTQEKTAMQQDPMQQDVPSDPRVRVGKLANGMMYYLQANEKPEDRAELRLAVKAGSINEDDDQLGLAHFVEHMAFNGTKHFAKSELVDYLQSVGTRFGADLNAYTSFDETVYMLQVRTDSQEIFDQGLLILEDWANAITFEDEEIDKERGVVLSELRSGLSANERMRNEYLPVIFHESRYAQRLPIGTREILSEAPYDALKRFYWDWYRPNLMAVVVVGNIDVDAMEQEIIKRFGQLENPETPRSRATYGFPDHEETLVSIVKDKEANFTTARVMYKHDHQPVKTIKDYRRSLVQNLYNRMLNSRLNELRQSADPPFLYGYSGYGQEVGELDTYTAYVTTGEGEVKRGLEAVLLENKRVFQHGFTQTELDRNRIEMISEAETAAKEEDKTESGSLAMRYVYKFLRDNPVPSPTQRLQLMQALLPTIQLEEINNVAEEWITDGSNRVIVVTGPDKETVPLPDKDAIFELIDKVDAAEVEPYVDEVSDVPLIAELPTAGSVLETDKIPEVGITEWRLSNGVLVVLKPTDFQNDEIRFSAFSPGGHSNYPDEDYQSASLASAIVNQSGIGSFDLVQLQKMLAGKQVQVGPFISELEEGLSGFSTIKDLETMFQLIHLYFTQPRRDDQAYQSLMTRQKQILANLLVDPNYYFRDRVTNLKYNNHIRRGIPTVEDLESVSLDRIMEVYRDRFADASDFTFTFVGNFTEEDIRPLIEQYVATLPSIDREETWQDVEADIVTGKHIERFDYGKAPKSQIEMTWSGMFDWDDRESRYHFDALLEVLRNKLRESMREDQGGVYGVRVAGGVSRYPREDYNVTISFNAEPEEVDTLIRTAKRDIAAVMESGAEAEEIQKVVEIQRQSRITSLKENGFWSNSLRTYYRYDLDPKLLLLENYEPLLESLTGEDIKRMANRIFDTENYLEVVMMPAEGEGE